MRAGSHGTSLTMELVEEALSGGMTAFQYGNFASPRFTTKMFGKSEEEEKPGTLLIKKSTSW